MGLKNITPGRKTAKPVGARFIKSGKKETPAIEVEFEFEEPSTGERERLTWQGWLTENSEKRTYETLANVIGSNGNIEAMNDDGHFTDPKFVDRNREVSLVVELEEAKNEDGSTKVNEKTGEVQLWPRIKWVNNIGGSMYANVTPEVAKSSLGALGFKAKFLAAKQAVPNAPQVPNHAPTFNAAEKLPF